MSVDDVRRKIGGSTPAPANIATFLCEQVRELQKLGVSSKVKSAADLVPVLAADMKRKSAASGGETHTDQEWQAMAKQQIESNRTTALTTSDDRYTGLADGLAFDELHELIHICSAPGGESDLMRFKLQMNEGAINYFAELVAPKAGVTVVGRYTEETQVARRLVALLGADGVTKLYEMTFKGQVDPFFTAVGQAYVARGQYKGFSEKTWTPQAAGTAFRDKVANWVTKWLLERLPAA
jgi:hypothetical protein